MLYYNYVVGGSVQRFGTMFGGNGNLDVLLVYTRRKQS